MMAKTSPSGWTGAQNARPLGWNVRGDIQNTISIAIRVLGCWMTRRSHACACHYKIMRTTVEMKPEHRSALLAMASRRGQKGFSAVLGEAIESYLQGEQDREKRRHTFLSLAGSISRKDAEDLRQTTRQLRESWR